MKLRPSETQSASEMATRHLELQRGTPRLLAVLQMLQAVEGGVSIGSARRAVAVAKDVLAARLSPPTANLGLEDD